MTTGHKHREITLKEHGIVLHLLQTPLARTADEARANQSRWVWGETLERGWSGGVAEYFPVYVLTPLSILHTLTGLTVKDGS